MFLILVALFIGLPIAEIALLLKVGNGFGFVNTLSFVIFTAVLGAYLVRQQGLSTLNRVRAETEAGRMPATEMAEGVLLLIAGAVLLTPGFITDAIGFSLLVPMIRRAVIKRLAKHSMQSAANGSSTGFIFTSQATRQNQDYQSNRHDQPKNADQDLPKKSREGVIIEGNYRDSD